MTCSRPRGSERNASMNTGATTERKERVSLLPFTICRGGFSPDGRARFRPPVRSRLWEAGRTEPGMEPKALGGGGRVMSAGRVCRIHSEPENLFQLSGGKVGSAPSGESSAPPSMRGQAGMTGPVGKAGQPPPMALPGVATPDRVFCFRDRQATPRFAAALRFPSASVPARANTLAL